MPLRHTKEDDQSLGSGEGEPAWHHVYALGQRSRNEQGRDRSLRGGLRGGVAEPFAGRMEDAGAERHDDEG